MRYSLNMRNKQLPPVSLRVNEADLAVLKYLTGRLGLGNAQVIKLAIRRLEDEERRNAARTAEH